MKPIFKVMIFDTDFKLAMELLGDSYTQLAESVQAIFETRFDYMFARMYVIETREMIKVFRP